MARKNKAVNHAQIEEMIDILHQAAQTPDRDEQDKFIARAEALYSTLNDATAKGLWPVTPAAYMAVEARHISEATGESLPAATQRLDDLLRRLGKRAYKVYFWPNPTFIVTDLRKAGDHLILQYESETLDHENTTERAGDDSGANTVTSPSNIEPNDGDSVVQELERLASLFQQDLLTEAEYTRLKSRLIEE